MCSKRRLLSRCLTILSKNDHAIAIKCPQDLLTYLCYRSIFINPKFWKQKLASAVKTILKIDILIHSSCFDSSWPHPETNPSFVYTSHVSKFIWKEITPLDHTLKYYSTRAPSQQSCWFLFAGAKLPSVKRYFLLIVKDAPFKKRSPCMHFSKFIITSITYFASLLHVVYWQWKYV